MKLENVKAVITGGVSGLGLATARYLAAKGAKVALLDINDKAGRDVSEQLGATYIRTDVTSESGVKSAIAQASSDMGGLNVAVSCAGVIGAGRVLGREGPMDLDFFSTVIQINLVGSFNVAKAAAAVMENNEPLRGWRTRRHHQHRFGSRLRGANRAGGILRLKGRRGWNDPSHRPGAGALRCAHGHHRTRHFLDAHG